MLWFIVWTVLVVGALVGAFFLLRHVYRQGRDLLHELERAADVLAQVTDRAEELAAAAAALNPPAPVDLGDPAPARARRHEALLATARRRAARAERHERTYARWRAFSR